MSDQEDYYKHLCGIMYRTRGCRFSASARLKNREIFSIGTVAFLSVYLIAWSVISLSYPELITANHSRFYNAISVVASVSLLTMSIFDFALSRSVVAEKLNRNALEISQIMRDLERNLEKNAPDFALIEGIAKKYEDMIAANEVNHTTSDDKLWTYSVANSKNPIISVMY